MKLPTRESIVAWLSVRENQARLMVLAWYISLGMMMMGYILMAYVLFGQK